MKVEQKDASKETNEVDSSGTLEDLLLVDVKVVKMVERRVSATELSMAEELAGV